MIMVKRIFSACAVGGFVFFMFSHVASAARINFIPSAVSLTEGESQEVTITLEEPIICADVDPPCQISLAISTSSPSRATITTSPVVIPANQWFAEFTFTVTAVDDELLNGDITPTVTIENESLSEFYDGFIPTFSITILDNEVAQQAPQDDEDPAEQVSITTENTPTLPATGQNQPLLTILVAVVFISTFAIVLKNLSSLI